MKEFLKRLIPRGQESNEPPIDERYPIGARGKREQSRERHKSRWRGKISLPYEGNQLHEYIWRAAGTNNPHERRLFLNKVQKEINRQKAAEEEKFFD
jgi:hypothetical protein